MQHVSKVFTVMKAFIWLTMAATALSAPKVVQIPRRHNPTLAEFNRDFGSTSLPVIISGSTSDWGALNYSREEIRRKCGGRKMIEPCDEQHQVKVRGSVGEWAGVRELSEEEVGNKSLNDIMDLQDRGDKDHHQRPDPTPNEIKCVRDLRVRL